MEKFQELISKEEQYNNEHSFELKFHQLCESNQNLQHKLDETKILLETTKDQHANEILIKVEVINQLKTNIQELKTSNSHEVLRLENKLELLRLEHEKGDTSSQNGDYSKVMANYSNLQNEYLQSQENWKLIEINLTHKIDQLNSIIDQFKKNKLQLNNDIKHLKDKIVHDKHIYEGLLNNFEKLQEKFDTLKVSHSNCQNDSITYKQQLDDLTTKYNTLEKDNKELHDKITLESSKLDLSHPENFNNGGAITPGMDSGGLGIRSSSLSHNLDIPTPNEMSHSDSFDQISEFNSVYNHSNYSNNSMTDVNQPTNPIQLINKMSSNIKLLKVELTSVKDENALLSNQKEHLQKKLLSYNNLSQEIDSIKSELESVTHQLSVKTNQEQVYLEVIGEKEERIDELDNDVKDLKDLCRLQVQQMIEMHEGKQ